MRIFNLSLFRLVPVKLAPFAVQAIALLLFHPLLSYADEAVRLPNELQGTNWQSCCLKYFDKGRLQHWDWCNTPLAALALINKHGGNSPSQYIEVSLCSSALDPTKIARAQEGHWGLMVHDGEKPSKILPTDMIQSNLSFQQVLDRKRQAFPQRPWSRFECHTYLVSAGKWTPLTRSGSLVPPLDRAEFENFSVRLKAHQLRQLTLNQNLLPYSFDPVAGQGRSEEPRQARIALGSWSLANLASSKQFPLSDMIRHWQAFRSQYYRESPYGPCFGYKSEQPLGGLALAGLAVLRQDELRPPKSQHDPLVAQLGQTLLNLQRADGLLLCKVQLATAEDPLADPNQAFYPGEALLFAAELYRSTKDQRYRQFFEKSWPYYLIHQQTTKKIAPVPWLVQAGTSMWKVTKDPKLAQTVLSLQDWHLSSMTSKPGLPDTEGALGAASGTGVNLEGLLDAFEVACATGDIRRSQRYRSAIVAGFRFLCQLQYRDNSTYYWVAEEKRPWVEGGIRSQPWDPNLQIDNQSHALNAVLKLESLESRGILLFQSRPKS